MAALAASTDVADRWGANRPLGQIAQEVYLPAVRDAVPSPGPIVIFTSGLYPGHSAQYNRVSVAGRTWKKIGDTMGFGNFQVSVETAEAMRKLNREIDGYEHITKAFGEGSGARFRSVGRALAYLGLPDLRKHETRRPLYVLPLVSNPRECLLGWEDPAPLPATSARDIAEAWWRRWVGPKADKLVPAARSAEDLESVLHKLLARAKSRPQPLPITNVDEESS
ncbi:Druantia anti-phage system protein DruA [Micromonospora vinacea]|uniref:Druantia anti-phage system protein DruA n=1 Tax=Micromonospora vinacea TaxID=709878 RepID=UPI003D918C1D